MRSGLSGYLVLAGVGVSGVLLFVAAMLAQKVQLLMGFHAFGDYRQVQAVGHGDYGAGDLCVLLAGR